MEALAGLAREVDGLRRGMEVPVDPDPVDDLARTVAQLADAVAATPARPGPTVAPSWLTAPTEGEATLGLLEDLAGWLRAVFLRYPDGTAVLPECWLWHPDVVEELLWLMQAWRAAYEGRGASVQLAGDWHDRQRPGVDPPRADRPPGRAAARTAPDPTRLARPTRRRHRGPVARRHRRPSRRGGRDARDEPGPEPARRPDQRQRLADRARPRNQRRQRGAPVSPAGSQAEPEAFSRRAAGAREGRVGRARRPHQATR